MCARMITEMNLWAQSRVVLGVGRTNAQILRDTLRKHKRSYENHTRKMMPLLFVLVSFARAQMMNVEETRMNQKIVTGAHHTVSLASCGDDTGRGNLALSDEEFPGCVDDAVDPSTTNAVEESSVDGAPATSTVAACVDHHAGEDTTTVEESPGAGAPLHAEVEERRDAVAAAGVSPPAASTRHRKSSVSPGHAAFSLANVYFDRDLSPHQRHHFLEALRQIRLVFGNDISDDETSEKVASLCNLWHISQFEKDHTGCGGLLRKQRVEQLLRKEGQKVLGGQLGTRSVPAFRPIAPPVPYHVPSVRGPMPFLGSVHQPSPIQAPQLTHSDSGWWDNPGSRKRALESLYEGDISQTRLVHGKKRKLVTRTQLHLMSHSEMGWALKAVGVRVRRLLHWREEDLKAYFDRDGTPDQFWCDVED